MNRQRGLSSLLMVLLLLALGTLLLQGLHQQQRSLLAQTVPAKRGRLAMPLMRIPRCSGERGSSGTASGNG